MPYNMKKAGMAYRKGGPAPKRVMPTYSKGGQTSLLTKISRAPKRKKAMKGCGCGGQV